MKKNKLSVWTFPCNKRYYLTHPWRYFYELYWNFRNFIHRGRYGYAYVDVWNFGSWFPMVGSEALRYLAEHNSGYPSIEPWETPEKWREYLIGLADKLQFCAESVDGWPSRSSDNEYQEAMDAITEKGIKKTKGDDGLWYYSLDITPEEQEIRDKYFAREEELWLEREAKREQIFGELGKNLARIWD